MGKKNKKYSKGSDGKVEKPDVDKKDQQAKQETKPQEGESKKQQQGPKPTAGPSTSSAAEQQGKPQHQPSQGAGQQQQRPYPGQQQGKQQYQPSQGAGQQQQRPYSEQQQGKPQHQPSQGAGQQQQRPYPGQQQGKQQYQPSQGAGQQQQRPYSEQQQGKPQHQPSQGAGQQQQRPYPGQQQGKQQYQPSQGAGQQQQRPYSEQQQGKPQHQPSQGAGQQQQRPYPGQQQGKQQYQPSQGAGQQQQRPYSEQQQGKPQHQPSQGAGQQQQRPYPGQQQGKQQYQPSQGAGQQQQRPYSEQQQGKQQYQPSQGAGQQQQRPYSEQQQGKPQHQPSQGAGQQQQRPYPGQQQGKQQYQPSQGAGQQQQRPYSEQQQGKPQHQPSQGAGQQQQRPYPGQQQGKQQYQPSQGAGQQQQRPYSEQQQGKPQHQPSQGAGQQQQRPYPGHEHAKQQQHQQQVQQVQHVQQAQQAQQGSKGPQTSKNGKQQHIPQSPTRGSCGKPFELETNYLTLNLNKMPNTAYHYDVKIDPDRPKKFIRTAFSLFNKQVFPNISLAFDGKASAYSVILLDEKILNNNQEYKVMVTEDTREIPFKVTLKPTSDIEIDLGSLKSYHSDRIFDKPMRALQCIEVVLTSPCHEKAVRGGRSFFIEPKEKIDLGEGYELWYGLFQAAMLCDSPFLNVDISHKSFPSKQNLVNLYDDYVSNRKERNFDEALKGLRLIYSPPKCFNSNTPKGFKFVAIKNPSERQQFRTDDGKQQTVAEYFASKGYKLKRPELPCIHVGSTVKNIYIPMELLDIPPGQAILHKDTDLQVRNMIRYAATSTDIRKQKIMNLLSYFNYNANLTIQRFGLSVGSQFINVPARLLTSPLVKYANDATIRIGPSPGEWAMKNVRFLRTTNGPHKWAILNISRDRYINKLALNDFINLIRRTSGKLGMNLYLDADPKVVEPNISPHHRNVFTNDYLSKLKQEQMSIVFVIIPTYGEAYSQVKQDAEITCGIVTQCIKAITITKKCNPMTIENILLKVNAKLNGTNHKIDTPIGLNNLKIMFIGADVSHPSPMQSNLPSIVGSVASHDLFGTQYNMQYRFQQPKLETIEDMKGIFTYHLKMFNERTREWPTNIIYYRDGVDHGHFETIRKVELEAMRAVCKANKIDPKFTCIIVIKRHHTRFFPKRADGEGKFNNVKAGTVVDRTIVHPGEVQFFMVSHKAIQGTSRPTCYNVIVDDANIHIDDIQALTYSLCHLFPRCNRSVSYPAPAYLAHLVALRGRAYIGSANLNLQDLKKEYTKRQIRADVMSNNPMYFV